MWHKGASQGEAPVVWHKGASQGEAPVVWYEYASRRQIKTGGGVIDCTSECVQDFIRQGGA